MLTPARRSRQLLPLALSAFLAGLLAACTSNLLPMRPLIRTSTWIPDASTTQPTTSPATAPATQFADTQPTTTTAPSITSIENQKSKIKNPATTRPGHTVTTLTDPNEVSRYIYHADYDNLWRQSMATLTQAGFLFDRLDYRLGVITTKPLPSAQLLEFWKPEHTTAKNAFENTINNQRRIVRITISPDSNKPDFYRIAIQVAVERQSNPEESISGPLFVEGSAYGRSSLSLRSDYLPAKPSENAAWVLIGHDPTLEHKLLNALFKRI